MAELFLVIVILATLSAVAVPRFANFTARQRLEAAARRVVVELAYAQQLAKRKGAAVTVQFSIPADTLEVLGEIDRNRGVGPYLVAFGDEPYGVVISSADFGGDANVVFDAFGLPDSGGSLMLALGTYTKSVSLDADSGAAGIAG